MKKSFLLAIGIAGVFVGMGIYVGASALRGPSTGPNAATADNSAAAIGKTLAGIVREVTAYNVGVREQTSDTPCVGARGHDLCRMVKQGRKVCAANFVSLGTVLRIERYGECVVLDRMHRRFAHRVDIAMAEHEVTAAREFGLQRRVVEVKY